MDPTRNSIKFCENLGKSAMETMAMIRQAFRGKKALAVGIKSKLTETEKAERDKEQSQEHTHYFL
jgi:hypothetical protein